MQEGGQAALLCLACGRENPDAAERILVASIAESQQPDQAPVQVRVGSVRRELQIGLSKLAHILLRAATILYFAVIRQLRTSFPN